MQNNNNKDLNKKDSLMLTQCTVPNYPKSMETSDDVVSVCVADNFANIYKIDDDDPFEEVDLESAKKEYKQDDLVIGKFIET